MLACQRNSQLKELETELLSCRSDPKGGYWIELADTVLYPEGGGQPADHGAIGSVAVTDVQKIDGRTLHHTMQPIEPGTVRASVDWNRRFDHMQQHTGQHLLSAVAEDRLGLSTLSFHLGAKESHVELDGPPRSGKERDALEAELNAHIAAALPVRQREVRPEDFEDLGIRSRGLPADHKGSIRLIEIEGVDLNTCGGTHVQSTAALGVIHLTRWERYKSTSRLFFLVGGRVRAELHRQQAREQVMNRLLQGGSEAHIELVEKLLAREKESTRLLKRRSEELAEARAAVLAQAPGPLVHHHQEDGDMTFLRNLARGALAQDESRVFLLTAADASSSGVFLLAGDPSGVALLGPHVATALCGRGGGANGRFQGKGSQVQVSESLLDQLIATLREG